MNHHNSTNIHFSYQNQQVNQYPPMQSYHGLNHSSSARRLLTNPESSKVVQQEIQERVATKKTDVGKMLFDRKINKLLS